MACLFAAKLRLKSEKMSLCTRNGLSVQEEGRKKRLCQEECISFGTVFFGFVASYLASSITPST